MNPSGDGSSHADAADAALEGDASGSVIRGAAVRGGTYVLSTGLIALAFLLVLRDLGVDEFGRLSAALAVAAIVQSVGEAAISAVAQRLLVGSPAQDRPRLAAQFVGLRLVLMPCASALGIAFAVAAGYPPRQVAAVALACLGAVLTVTAAAWTVSLQIELRAARASMVELVRQVVVAFGLTTVALAGAGLVAYSAVYVLAGLLAVVIAIRLVAPIWRQVRLPTRSTVVLVVREATWLAVAVTVNSLFLKLLTVVASVTTSDEQTGVFATAARVVEVMAGLPLLMAAVAFPVLSRAAEQRDDARLASAVDRVVRGVVLLIGVVVVVVAVAARPIVSVFAGDGYEAAAPVLQLQVFALLASTITQGLVWALVALRGERVLMMTNVVGLIFLLTIGTVAARLDGARGLAVAAVVGETVLLLLTLLALRRVGRHAVPRLVPLAGVVATAVASATVGLLAPFGDIVGAGLGVVVFLVVVLTCRLVPLDALRALRRRS